MLKNLYSRKIESPGGDTHGEQQGRGALRWGKVVDVAPDFSQVRVENDELDQGVSYWLSILYPKAFIDKYYWCPQIDEYVWFLWDEQGEEGVVLGAFYNAEVPLSELHPPSPHKTEVVWGDQSFFFYDREEHELNLEIRGEIFQRASDGDFKIEASEEVHVAGRTITLEACEEIVLRAPMIRLEGSVSMAGGPGGTLSLAAGAASVFLGPGGLALGGAAITGNGTPLVGLGALVAIPHPTPGIVETTGLGGFAGGVGDVITPECPEVEVAEEVEVELQGDLRNLHGYTPPGFGEGG